MDPNALDAMIAEAVKSSPQNNQPMDLSKVPTADLLALRDGDLSKVSTPTLIAIRNHERAATQPQHLNPALQSLLDEANQGDKQTDPFQKAIDMIEQTHTQQPASGNAPTKLNPRLQTLLDEANGKPHDMDPVANALLLALQADREANNKQQPDAASTVPAWGREHPNLYGIAGAARETLGPLLEAGGLVGGGALGTTAGPAGSVGGAALGYGAAKEVTNLADQALGNTRPTSLPQHLEQTAHNIETGAMYDMGGRALAPAIGAALRGAYTHVVEPLVSRTIGDITTGAGSGSIRAAAKAGYQGGEAARAFTGSMRGREPMTQAVDDARSALAQMHAERAQNYIAGMEHIAQADKPLNFEPVDRAYKNLMDSMQLKGHWKVGADTQAKLGQIGKVLDEWRGDPALHTTLGFDALKQAVGDLMPNKLDAGQSRRAVTTIYNAIRNQIVKDSPEYAQVMNHHEESINTMRGIERELSLGDRNTEAQGLRKLQSAARDNAYTSWGHRVNMVKDLERYSPNIFNRIAGQSLSPWAPRGLNRFMAEGTAVGSAFHPGLAWTLPLQSPRLMGEAAYALGKGAGAVSRLSTKAAFPGLLDLLSRGSLATSHHGLLAPAPRPSLMAQ